MISFYPGPSRIYDDIPSYVKTAADQGILSMNHRSDEFMKMMEQTVSLMRDKLDVPSDFHVYFTSSATECWEIVAQSLVKEKSIHLYNGAFGAKWFEYTRKLKLALNKPFDREQLLDPTLTFSEGDIICITHNETSNGTAVALDTIATIRKNNPRHLIAVDATSSMAGVHLDFRSADIWLASVQKCFGLPAGLGVMICSPAAVGRMTELNESAHYNSLTLIHDMMKKWQTSCTPNVLAIYLLMRVLRKVQPIDKVEARLKKRMDKWVSLFDRHPELKSLVSNREVRSVTVIAVKGNETRIAGTKHAAAKAGFALGEGYGDLKKETFRIANFPAIKDSEVRALADFFSKSGKGRGH